MSKRINPYGNFKGTFIPLWLEQVEELSLLAKMVYAKLIYHSGGKGYAFPKQTTLEREIRPSCERSIRNAINDLINFQLIEVEKPTGKNRLMHKENRYYFLDHPLMTQWSEPADNDSSGPAENDSPEPACGAGPIEEINIKEEINKRVLSNDNTQDLHSEVTGAAPSQSALIRNGFKRLKKRNVPKINNNPITSEIFLYWDSKGLSIGGEGTKARKESVKKLNALIEGTLFKGTKYDTKIDLSIEEIKKAIDRYYDYSKAMKTKLTLGQFLYNPGHPKMQSVLLYLLSKAPDVELRKDKYPVLTVALKKEYERVILASVKPKYTTAECNCFITAAEKAMAFYRENRKLITHGDFLSPPMIAECMIEAITSSVRESEWSKISPSWLASDKQFSSRLPAYLNTQGVIREVSRSSFSIYDN